LNKGCRRTNRCRTRHVFSKCSRTIPGQSYQEAAAVVEAVAVEAVAVAVAVAVAAVAVAVAEAVASLVHQMPAGIFAQSV